MHRHHLSIAAVALWFVGCASHVEWTPDSKSFLYSHKDGRVLRYDLSTRRSTELTRADPHADWPVFSLRPDGKRIVVAGSTTVGDGTQLVNTKLRFLDAGGKALGTRSLTWPAAKSRTAERRMIPTYVEWSPQGTHVLVGTEDAVAVHDATAGTFVVHEDVGGSLLPGYVGAPLWRPDGQGFLAAKRPKGGREHFVFVTLGGEVQELKLDEIPKSSETKEWPRGYWKDSVLVTRLGSRELRFDTRTLRVTHGEVDVEERRTWPLGSSQLVLKRDGDDFDVFWTDGARKVRVTEKLGAAFTLPDGPVVVAPDGRRTVVVGKKELVHVGETGILDRIPVVRQRADAR